MGSAATFFAAACRREKHGVLDWQKDFFDSLGFSYTGGGGNVIRRKGGLIAKAVYPKAAVRFSCGEISVYVDEEDLQKLKK